MRRKPVDRGGTKKESQEAKRRNETGQTPAMSKRQWSENEPSVIGQQKTPATSASSPEEKVRSPQAKVEISFWCLQTEGGRESLGTAFAVHGGGNDAAGVARPFTAGEESGEAHVLQGVVVAHHTNG